MGFFYTIIPHYKEPPRPDEIWMHTSHGLVRIDRRFNANECVCTIIESVSGRKLLRDELMLFRIKDTSEETAEVLVPEEHSSEEYLNKVRVFFGPDSEIKTPRFIRAISLYQPWATLIAIGAKPYETRSWPTNYRGELAIHAGKSTEYLYLLDDPPFREALNRAGVNALDIPFGALVCTCTLANCFRATDVQPDPFGDYSEGRFAFHLTGVNRFPKPIPSRGHQGFWYVNPETGEALPRHGMGSPESQIPPKSKEKPKPLADHPTLL